LKLISQADWTKLNTDEFSLLYPGPDPIAERLPAFVNEYELQGIILTHGSKGAEVLTEDGGHFTVKPQLDVSVVDTVGAGDAFTSVMITGIVNNWPMQITLDRAQAFASNIVGRRGATVDDPDFYRLVMDHWQSD
jgi:fructokinase